MTEPNDPDLPCCAEVHRLRKALLHIATGGISPAIGFAQRILLGHSISDAHAAEGAIMFRDQRPECRRCSGMRKVLDCTSHDVPRFYDCPGCTGAAATE